MQLTKKQVLCLNSFNFKNEMTVAELLNYKNSNYNSLSPCLRSYLYKETLDELAKLEELTLITLINSNNEDINFEVYDTYRLTDKGQKVCDQWYKILHEINPSNEEDLIKKFNSSIKEVLN